MIIMIVKFVIAIVIFIMFTIEVIIVYDARQ